MAHKKKEHAKKLMKEKHAEITMPMPMKKEKETKKKK